ncbi:hypothetical protein GCM10028820_07610 [Tessaracoccus terricola]
MVASGETSALSWIRTMYWSLQIATGASIPPSGLQQHPGPPHAPESLGTEAQEHPRRGSED